MKAKLSARHSGVRHFGLRCSVELLMAQTMTSGGKADGV